MANEALYYGTGRRKNAVARVRLVPGTGKVTVNGRDGKEYFGREALLDYAKTPFRSRIPRITSTCSPASTAAASRVRPALCVTASPVPCWQLATTVPS